MPFNCNFSFHVSVVSAAILYIYFSTVLVFIDQWFGLSSSPGLLNFAVFTYFSLMAILTYVLSIFTDPGRVPSSFWPELEDPDALHEVKRKGGDLRYCQKCSFYKPPRAHHCRVCNRCVLRMDHHCVWLNNCVGHANYKLFFIFVVYAVVSCIYSLVLLLGSLTRGSSEDDQQEKTSFRTIYVISGLLLGPLSIALTSLLGWHIYLMLQNKTTIEFHEGVRAMWVLVDRRDEADYHPYNLGAYENLISVLGPNVICWFCPTVGHIGSGLCFRRRHDNTPHPQI